VGLQWAYQIEPLTKARPGAHRYGIPGVFRDLWTIPARYKGAYGGRGSGKSHNFAAMAVTRASEIDGLRIACIREIQNTLDQSVKQLVEDKISSLGFRGFEPLERITRTPGGGLIIYRGMQSFNADNIKSLEGFDVVWVEEAHSLSQYSLDILRPTLRKSGSEYWFSWNPNSPDDPVDRFLRAERPTDSIVVEANWCDNPYFPEVLRQDKDYDLRRSPERYAHIWMGAYRIRSEAQVFRNWRVEEFESPPRALFRLGADWATASTRAS
jgi:phage terminase large subunit